jgi:hypothetical protein
MEANTMKRTIPNIPILNIEGRPLQLPTYDITGKPVTETASNQVSCPNCKAVIHEEIKVNKLADGKLSDCLRMMLRFFPVKEYPQMENVQKVNQLWMRLDSIKPTDVDFQLSDGLFDWTLKMLKDEKVGVAMFGVNVLRIQYALENRELKDEDGD